MDRSRLSLNQITTERLSLADAIAACKRHGVGNIGIWRYKVAEAGLAEAKSMILDAGLAISGLCRGGMFPAPTDAERQARIDDNLRAIDQAAAVGAELLVLVCGPAPNHDLAGARAMIADGIGAIRSHAHASGVRLGIEPLHPMFAAERSIITTLKEATILAERLDVWVVVDAFHVWWDHELAIQIRRAGPRIAAFHVSDWLVPLPDLVMGRGMMGDGVIPLRGIREMIDQAGYAGPVEVEIFNRGIWDSDADEVLATVCRRFQEVL